MGPQAKAEMDIDNLDVLADRGYFSGEEVMACEPLGVMPYVPKPLTSGTKADVRFGKQDFVYIPEQDSLPSAGPDAGDELCTVRLAFDTRRVRGGLIIEAPGVRPEVAPRPDRTLIRALALAAIWSRELATGHWQRLIDQGVGAARGPLQPLHIAPAAAGVHRAGYRRADPARPAGVGAFARRPHLAAYAAGLG